MPRTLLSLYPRPPDRFDELLAPAGGVRSHWQPLIETLDNASPEQLRERVEFVQRRIHENGITYNVYADPKGADRPWELDVLPLILPAAEWRGIEAAIAQRARLLDAVLGDIYGPQRLLAEGILPPSLIYGHNGYLWPCQGIRPPGGRFLHLYSADIARSPDGRWWVIADRTQGPSGAGYALENRLIVSRIFPELFRDLRVHHLADFFRALQEYLAARAPIEPGEVPLIVLLTPGPFNETYFEHSYLARYLGYPLVEGQDLTVRGDTVFLKTLGGLRRVHAILRRLDDDYCDPLELRGDSTLGVPGLVEAARAGRVLVANALGSGVLESAGLLGFMPGAAERLLGEPLLMPAVATWWCGEEPALDYVAEHLEDLVLKPAYPSQKMEPVFGKDLSAGEREALMARVRARPNAFVGQELVHLSQAPVLSRNLDRRLLARSIGLRVYAVATADGWQVMPGGLTRVAGSGAAEVISMQRGGSSKDTWVLSETPVSTFSLLKPELGARDLVRSGPQLSSRSVENLFWFGRYAERTENSARLLRNALSRLVEEGDEALQTIAVGFCERLGLVQRPGEVRRGTQGRLCASVFDASLGGSLADTVRRVMWAAGHIRERLAVDHWHALNRLQDAVRRGSGQAPRLDQAFAALDRVLLCCTSLAGFAMDDMMRDAGWRFLIVGRRIERLQFLARAVGGFLDGCDGEPVGVECLLDLADSAETYRYRYMRSAEILPALDVIVFDPDNPRSVAFQADMLHRYVERLRRDFDEVQPAALGDLYARLRSFDLGRLELGHRRRCAGRCGGCEPLVALLKELDAEAGVLSERLAQRFFTHVGDATASALAF